MSQLLAEHSRLLPGMEASESEIAQRTTTASISHIAGRSDHQRERDHHNRRTSLPQDASRTNAMATAALISPNTPYYPHHPASFPSTIYPSGQTPPTVPAMISPVESRRTSDDRDMAHRQSLPSIQEVIGKSAGSSYTSAMPAGIPSSQSLPSPFAPTAPSRPYSTDSIGDRQNSPRSLHHTASSSTMYGPRSDSVHSFSNPLRPQPPTRVQDAASHTSSPTILEPSNGLPPVNVAHQQLLQRHQHEPQPQQAHHQQLHHTSHHQAQHESSLKHEDSPSHIGTYTHPHSSNQQPLSAHCAPQQPLSVQGQMQLSASYPVSPRHTGPTSLPSPFEAAQHSSLQDSPSEFGRTRTRYDQAVNRHFEAWSYAEYLARIGSNARTIYNFADAFGSIAREEHSPQPIPGRMPADREVCEMINNAEWLKTMLENLRSIVQQTAVNERGGSASNRQNSANYDDPDAPMYATETLAKPYTLNEVKKRRGRAAPPGRCHSCNRIDTPEWRRGPDGARTLCNACGLHYAKLERKKQLESRALRPKHPEDRR